MTLWRVFESFLAFRFSILLNIRSGESNEGTWACRCAYFLGRRLGGDHADHIGGLRLINLSNKSTSASTPTSAAAPTTTSSSSTPSSATASSGRLGKL